MSGRDARAFSGELAVASGCHADCLAEHSGGVASAVPADPSYGLLDGQLGFAQYSGQVFCSEGREVGHRGLAVGIDEDPSELRPREMDRARHLIKRPAVFGVVVQKLDDLTAFVA